MRTAFQWTLAAVAACTAAILAHPRAARSADHLDSPAVNGEATADIDDLYAFMDGDRVVLAMTVYPAAPAGAKFSDQVQYVVHTTSGTKFGEATSSTDVICTFDAAQSASCWVGAGEHAAGDASAAAGIASPSGKVKVFAGLRADPFFFNLEGFRKTVDIVKGAASGLAFDTAGCPALDQGTSDALVAQLRQRGDGASPPADFFASLNTLAIVVSVDKALLTKSGPIVSAWASTNRKP